MNNATLLRLVAETLDITDIIDILGITPQEICILYAEEIIKNREKFEELLPDIDDLEF